jgi:radical SAM superfamily enzyme YgiQ (UPF0313 family)
MKVTVIKVNMSEGKCNDALKPLIFPILAHLTPEGIEMEFLDDRVEKLPQTLTSDIIALSFDTYAARRAYQLAKKHKTEDNIIALGGFHASLLPEEAMAYGDVIIAGDAEDTWPRFIEDAINGRVSSLYTSEQSSDFAPIDMEHPAFRGKRYKRIGQVQFSRGCRFCCDFCSIRAMYPGKVRRAEIGRVIEEVKAAKEKTILFIDDNLLTDEEAAISLCRELKPLKKKWGCQISMDAALNDRLLAMMKESGCIMVMMGFESLNKKNLEQMNKSANIAVGGYDRAIDNVYKHGLLIYAAFVLGYDQDTKESFDEVLSFAMKHNFTVANFNPLTPMPGTPLYKRLEQEGRLIYDKWWLSEVYRYGDAVFRPRQLSPEELRDGCRSIRYRFYGARSILKRLFTGGIHLKPYSFFLFMAMNIISNREIHRKQGRPLGDMSNEAGFDKTQYRQERA